LLQKVLQLPDMPMSATRSCEEIGSAIRTVIAR